MTDKELEKAMNTHYKAVVKAAMSFLGNMADSEDIAEEAFIKLYLRHAPLPDDTQTRAWLIKVTANLCRNRLRSPWYKRREEIPGQLPCEANGISREDRQELQNALNSLKPGYRAVIHLYYYEGFSAADIAKMLGISKTAVTTRLQRGREALKKFLSDDV